MAQDFVVGSEAELNAALSRIDAGGAAGAPGTASTITLGGDIALTADLTAIDLAAGSTLSIRGAGHTLDGGGQFRGLLDYVGQVSISSLAIDDAVATGGAGGGGGAGLGGGLLVAAAGQVVLDDVTFARDGAVGGASSLTLTGGGGLGGTAGAGGGGGVGTTAVGGGTASAPGPGVVAGAAAGGGDTTGGQGGAAGGGGAAGQPAYQGSSTGGDGGGGVGGGAGRPGDSGYGITTGSGGGGGAGGFGGGGGAGGTASVAYKGGSGGTGGDGGFGGGGGTGGVGHNGSHGGNGGFGGGGGTDDVSSQNYLPAANGGGAGFGGGTNATQTVPAYTNGAAGGGGGLGAGGAIFVEQGGSLTYAAGSESGGSVTGGAGAGPDPSAGDGLALGSGIFIQGDEAITLSATAAGTLSIGDVIADQTGSTHQTGLSAAGDPLAGAGSVLVQGAGTVVLGAANTYSGGTTLAAGTLELAVQGAAGSGPIRFDGAAVLAIDPGALPSATPIQGFARGDGIDLLGVRYGPADTVATSGGTTTVTADDARYALDIEGGGSFALSAAADGSVLLGVAAPCYAAGTRIDTLAGEVRVEDLRAGDLVSLASGGSAAVVWVGHRRVDLRRHPEPASARPVRVRAGSFGAGLPRRDLVLSPEHALFLDGALVPVRVLVDGTLVVQEAWERVTYHHVELSRHDVMLAEGLPAESYLDTGNRAQFAQGVVASLHPSFDAGGAAAEACAPLALSGPAVEAARARLRALAPRLAG